MRLNVLGVLCAPMMLAGALAAQSLQPSYMVTPIGPGCGPTLTAYFTVRGGDKAKLNLDLTGAWEKSHSLTYFGVDNIAYTFPGTLCTLYTLPVWQFPAMTDDAGCFSWSRAWPQGFYGYYNLQTAVFRYDASGDLEFALSNAVRVSHE